MILEICRMVKWKLKGKVSVKMFLVRGIHLNHWSSHIWCFNSAFFLEVDLFILWLGFIKSGLLEKDSTRWILTNHLTPLNSIFSSLFVVVWENEDGMHFWWTKLKRDGSPGSPCDKISPHETGFLLVVHKQGNSTILYWDLTGRTVS